MAMGLDELELKRESAQGQFLPKRPAALMTASGASQHVMTKPTQATAQI